MSKPRSALDDAAIIVFLVFLGFTALLLYNIFLLFFVPVAGFLIWRDGKRIRQLQERLSKLEKPTEPENPTKPE